MAITYETLPLEEDNQDSSTRQVVFTCSETGISTTRTVNYCEDEDDWNERLEQQALGVQNKIQLGVITESPEEESEVTE
jgi:hypothetical protein